MAAQQKKLFFQCPVFEAYSMYSTLRLSVSSISRRLRMAFCMPLCVLFLTSISVEHVDLSALHTALMTSMSRPFLDIISACAARSPGLSTASMISFASLLFAARWLFPISFSIILFAFAEFTNDAQFGLNWRVRE